MYPWFGFGLVGRESTHLEFLDVGKALSLPPWFPQPPHRRLCAEARFSLSPRIR